MLCLKKFVNVGRIRNFGNVRWSSSTKRDFKEVSIKVPWGQVAGKWWEPYDTRPILAIHGWQDNCQSFDRLIPMLNKDVGFLAIDLPGHGYSSRIPMGMMYHSELYLLTIRSIAKSLNWSTVSLMGHSLGSILSFVYSLFFSTEVDFLICIDTLKPIITRKKYNEVIPVILEQFFKYNHFAFDSREPPSYTLEEIKVLVAKPNDNSILPEYTTYIMERNIAPSKKHLGKYYFTRDPRVKMGVVISVSHNELLQLAERIKMPIFVVKAKDSTYYDKKEKFYEVLNVVKKSSIDCEFHYAEGRHHLHLNKPENISDLINKFLTRHNIQNRITGGKYYFTRDPRVKVGAVLSFHEDELLQLAELIKMPMLLIKAKESTFYIKKEKFFEVLDVIRSVNKNCEFHYAEGRHHLHLNNPEGISEFINNFIARHNINDRSVGGIKKEIITEIKPSCIV